MKELIERSRLTVSAFIIAFITVSTLLSAGFFIASAVSSADSNYAKVTDFFYVCEPLPAAASSMRIAVLRLDDVQAYGWTDISIKMMKDALSRDMTIVAGVIPKNINDDPRIVRFLSKHDCNVEIAVHGYDHGGGAADSDIDIPEFGALSLSESLKRIDAGIAELRKFSKQDFKTFIPPQNRISESAKTVLGVRGLSILSAEGTGYFDYHAATWSFEEDRFMGASETLAKCESAWERGPLCVIMLHPQDFAIENTDLDKDRYEEYIKLLDGLVERGAAAMTFPQAAEATEKIREMEMEAGQLP